MKLHRREFILLSLLGAAGAPVLGAASRPQVEVWKGPSCGCCKDWIKHMEANGFDAMTHDGGNADARARLGMPITYGSCHTALI